MLPRPVTYYLFTVSLLLSGCTDEPWSRGKVDAYVPIYSTDPSLKQVQALPARSTVHGGKIYMAGAFALEEEQDSGLHVISYQDPARPEKKGFIRIPGLRSLVIRDQYLYVSNYDDLVVIALNNLPAATETGRVAHAWQQLDYPPYAGVYFECVDPAKGTVIGWKKTIVDNPKCRR